MKWDAKDERGNTVSRPPRGGRGLKFHVRRRVPGHLPLSPPSRGAWIEMGSIRRRSRADWSPPSRGAWIEIVVADDNAAVVVLVAPLAGGVD